MGKSVDRTPTLKEESPCRRYMQLALHFEPVEYTHVRVAGSQPLIRRGSCESPPLVACGNSRPMRGQRTSLFASFCCVSSLRQHLDKSFCSFFSPTFLSGQWFCPSLTQHRSNITSQCHDMVEFGGKNSNMQMHHYASRSSMYLNISIEVTAYLDRPEISKHRLSTQKPQYLMKQRPKTKPLVWTGCRADFSWTLQ